MRSSWWWTLTAIGLAGAAANGYAAAFAPAQTDPERILADHLQFSAEEIAGARAGQPVVKMLSTTDRDEIGFAGAMRLTGKKERLSDWLRNIEHFRTSAQLGTAHVIPMPMTAAGFAGASADENVRNTLFGYANAYVKGGDAGIDAYTGSGARSFAADTRQLIQQATAVSALAPELVAYLQAYPKTTLAGVDQLLYWSSMPTDSDPIATVHQLVIYRRAANEVWIADKTLYATRDIDAGVLAIGLYDTPDGSGYFVVAGSRLKASRLASAAGRLLRRQIEREGADTVRMYLEWLRDSLAQA
jgi:hypothetical protein